jgi:sugar phosphate isomerase/epimerase
VEAGLKPLFRRAMPLTGLVQVSDYVLGDRSTPCRAVPGDGAMPLERLLGDVLDAGYTGLFDLELVGPRIEAEGGFAASRRAADYVSELLTRLGA